MAYDRYYDRREGRGPRARSPYGYERDDRGFFDRARDEVASWFGDDEAERRRARDERYDDRDDWIDGDRFGRSERAYYGDRDYGRYERSPRWQNEGYRRPYTGRYTSRAPYRDDYGYDQAYGNDRFDRGLTQREFTGTASGLYDRDYSNWRNRQIDQLDRDYEDFRNENSARFESEFSNWRNQRQAKRGLLSNVTEHMDVVGTDDKMVGKVDKIRGDRIILTRNDSPDGKHHSVPCSMIDKIEKDKVVLDCKAQDALDKLTSREDSQAFFEREERERGPHMLNRSFSGTY